MVVHIVFLAVLTFTLIMFACIIFVLRYNNAHLKELLDDAHTNNRVLRVELDRVQDNLDRFEKMAPEWFKAGEEMNELFAYFLSRVEEAAKQARLNWYGEVDGNALDLANPFHSIFSA